jgi:Flp pilus assembly protein TadB
MGNIESISNLTRLVQDVQYSSALREMTPEQKENYFRSQKQELMNNILAEREGAFTKMHTDAQRNNAIQTSLLFYQQRNQDLKEVGTAFDGHNKSAIQTAKFNNDLANRQYEINQWAYNNKMDTLFVFQLLFVSLALTTLFVYLSRIGLFGNALLGLLVAILLVIVILVLVVRAIYTANSRDQRYWNRRQFNKKEVPQGPGTICPPTEGFKDSQPAPLNE